MRSDIRSAIICSLVTGFLSANAYATGPFGFAVFTGAIAIAAASYAALSWKRA